MIHSLKNGT